MNLKYPLSFFIIIVLLQLYVPSKMIIDYEDIIKSGTYYKFEVAPIDPVDPFRGKFIFLQFKETVAEVENASEWKSGETAYLLLGDDENGYYKPKSILKYIPEDTPVYLKVNVLYPISDGNNKVAIKYPFERFYLEEFKAPIAEEVYQSSLRDSSRNTYALIAVKNGRGVVKDVKIDNVSIHEILSSGSDKKDNN